MLFTIHRGSHEIGGSCFELESGGVRILLEMGSPLRLRRNVVPKGEIGRDRVEELMDEGILPRAKGVYRGERKGVEALLITHAHQDHHGLMPFINPQVPVFMSRGTRALLGASEIFVPGARVPPRTEVVKAGQIFDIGPFRIEALLMDHSAPDALAFIIEAEGKRIFYTGDFRAGGRKGCFKALIRNPPADIDYLLTEGTNLGRSPAGPRNEYETEDSLTERFNAPGRLVLIFTAAQNLDRMVTISKAAHRAGRILVLDLYSAYVQDKLKAVSMGHKTMESDGVAVKFWNDDLKNLKARGEFGFLKRAYLERVEATDIFNEPEKYVMMGRSNRALPCFLRKFDSPGRLKVIWSLWSGYLRDRPFILGYCEKHNVTLEKIHASGHATATELRSLARAVNPGTLIPVHCEDPAGFRRIFPRVMAVADGNPIEL